MVDVNNMVLLKSGVSVTIYTTSVTEKISKKILVLTYPTPSANWSSGAKVAKILDLLRIQYSYEVSGFIDSADVDNFRSIIRGGGVFGCEWDGLSFSCNSESFEITKDAKRENDERDVRFTLVTGVDI